MSERVWPVRLTVVPYALLAVLTAVTVLIRQSDARPFGADLALCAAIGAWMLFGFTLRPAWRERPGAMGVFLAGFVVLMGWLVLRDPWFGFLTPAGYFYAFGLLPWPWRLAGISAVGVVAGTAQAYGVPKDSWYGWLTYAAVIAVNVLAMCLAAWLDWQRATLQRQLGVSDERERLAREIHDTLAQGLTGIITQLQAAEHATDDRRPHHLNAAIGLARESLREARRSVNALRPEPLQSAALSDALANVTHHWSTRHSIPAAFTLTGTPAPLSEEVESTLLRAAQEALANVAKHARATRVGVTLSFLDAHAALDIHDNGTGFTPKPDSDDGGFGLIAMRQRVEALGGLLSVESEPGRGTTVAVIVPRGGTS
ncbi:sensor histidine kinase [Kribbella sp. NPDC005582]|uniref:sensor histidine kinase n=1 Tax=Kribbella sp. NPDC005582 TaxID=3156893 RepID=UPI0033A56B5B